ncbi:MAG: hypothetical protein RLZZ157_1011 [Pseudomonadota bacterium]|jgi:diadenosine tetraphosphate (Ap4A) HIT family hydrolase
MSFALHPQLAADTHFVATLRLSDLLLMKDARYVWLILVPRRAGVRELHELADNDGAALWAEIAAISQLVAGWEGVSKVNVGALGNKVPQLHVHIIGRHIGDPAWPEPVWGHSSPFAYKPEDLAATLTGVRAALALDLLQESAVP